MAKYDLILRGGRIYDGSGSAPFTGDVAILGDKIAAVGALGRAAGKTEIALDGLAVAPGFINMLSWAVESLIEDGRSQSDIRQGVTLEVMGEGFSMGPLSDAMKAKGTRGILGNEDIQYDIAWTTLGEYLSYLEQRGVSTNIASFAGSSTLRIHAMGYTDRRPELDEIVLMRDLLREAMEEGAMGLSAALIYPPAAYAETYELIDLASVVAEYGGLYISHIRGEGSSLIEALDEFLEIVESAEVRGEIYHIKAAGQAHWHKMEEMLRRIEEARMKGLPVTADLYPYPYSGTGLDSCIPPKYHEGGFEMLLARLKDPELRAVIKEAMRTPSDEWENMFAENGEERILLSGFKSEALKPLTGKTLAAVAAQRGTSPEDTLLDLLIEDESSIFTIYFSMSEDNLRKQIQKPWISFCSDAESLAPEGVFLKSNPHPRAYGAFARVLGKYVRDEKLLSLEEAIHRLTAFPAQNLRIEGRGLLKEGYFADVVVFNPDKVQDHATPENPHQYAEGMVHVFVNGQQVLKDGQHTDAKPGRVVRGPGYKKAPFTYDYPEALHVLLTLPADYSGTYNEFNIGYHSVPDLIRMATDRRMLLLEDDRPEVHAPFHAVKRLVQLRAVEAAAPLTKIFDFIHPQNLRVFAEVFAHFGPKAIGPLTVYLNQPPFVLFGKSAAVFCLEQIANIYDVLTRRVCINLLEQRLEAYERNNPILNGVLVRVLVDLQTERLDLVKKVYKHHPEIQNYMGLSVEEVLKRIGAASDDDFEYLYRPHHHDLPRTVAKQGKAKRHKKKRKR